MFPIQPAEKPEELTRLEEFLGSELPWGQDISTATSGAGDASNVTTETSSYYHQSPEKSEPESECQASETFSFFCVKIYFRIQSNESILILNYFFPHH